MKINYAHKGVSALCMSPSILVSLLIMPSSHILISLPACLLGLALCGIAYYRIVERPMNSRFSTGQRYLILFAAQLLFWYSVVKVNARLL
ncbi:hypothetical protein [Pseudomonas aegrilactucae]|uniref:Uncharacterized protein n=1 Tax=Pseudomonas aegrilactucae TaxID=2854028 RepID=A0A9Q2XH33_9PSED|nr:hypothetical protein [Pseudomonas aegrilactucae]MBV6286936.1 hypothetical protein [Pseudomonas aegrilactucae]